jgi:L-fuculose-phosphate aldolase
MNSIKVAVLECARAMNASGINRGTSGNVSVRTDHGFMITPTGMDYDKVSADDMVQVSMSGAAHGKRKPSSEWRFHRDIYAHRPEAGAIVHTHAPFSTSLACLGMEIPSFHYMIARFGGNTVRCAEYATFGTQALSDAMLTALEGRSACLMAQHGMTVFGRDLDQALAHALELEVLAEQYWRVLQIGQPRLLADEEMAVVLEKFRTYGQEQT